MTGMRSYSAKLFIVEFLTLDGRHIVGKILNVFTIVILTFRTLFRRLKMLFCYLIKLVGCCLKPSGQLNVLCMSLLFLMHIQLKTQFFEILKIWTPWHLPPKFTSLRACTHNRTYGDDLQVICTCIQHLYTKNVNRNDPQPFAQKMSTRKAVSCIRRHG